MEHATRFAIRFDSWYRVLSASLGLRPADSYMEVGTEEVRVRMGWGFQARFPRSAVAAVAGERRAPLSRGIHGWAGRWLVNGSGSGILAIDLAPAQRARVLGFPVQLRRLLVSLEDPDGLRRLLGR